MITRLKTLMKVTSIRFSSQNYIFISITKTIKIYTNIFGLLLNLKF